jgi:hypothetical protein
MGLPQIECEDLVLEPINSLTIGGSYANKEVHRDSRVTQIFGLLNSVPLYFRYGFSAALVAVVAVAISLNVVTPIEEYSPQDIALSLQELNVAIDYLNQVSQRTEVMIGDRFLVTPLQDSINASFQRANIRENVPLNNGPI